jgi:peptide/nickel transport system substrate-binding protein
MRSAAPLWFAIAAIVLSGCARLAATGPQGGHHPWTLPGTVRIGMYEEPDTLNPVTSQMAFSSDVMQLIYDGLMRYDEKGHVVPDLAREIPSVANGGISRDGLTITYHLMPAARWHDGVPLTARDVIFTWHAIMNKANNTPTRVGYDRITSMDAPDPHTVRVHFKKPYAPAIYLFRCLAQGAILPEHLLGRLPDINRAAFNGKPVGSGPYVFTRWSHGSEMEFTANHAYFRGVPKIEHVVIKFVPNQNTLVGEMLAHELDMAYGFPPLLAQRVENVPDIGIASTSTLHWEHLNFNTRRPPLDDVVVRRALCSAIDEKTIYRDFYHGFGRMAPTHFNPDFGWGDPKIAYLPFDVRGASDALERDGWKLGSDGFRYKHGQKLAFDLSTVAGVKNREAIEVFLQSAWRAIGADVAIRNYQAAMLFEPAAAGGLISGGKTDIALFEWDNADPDPDDETYVGPHSMPPSGQNDSFYYNETVGRLEQTGLGTFDLTKRRAVYSAISDILIRDVPEYVLDWKPEIVAYNDDLVGVRPVPVGSDLWNIGDWRFK